MFTLYYTLTVSSSTPESRVRSIRISKELDVQIQQEAESEGVTVNALITSILKRYADWDRYAERFGFVTLPREGFRSLIEAVDKEKLSDPDFDLRLAKRWREMALLWFKRGDLESYLRYFTIQLRYGRLAKLEVQTSAEGDTISLHHDLGGNFSLLLSRGIEQNLGSNTKISAKLSVEENALAIHLPPGTIAKSQVA